MNDQDEFAQILSAAGVIRAIEILKKSPFTREEFKAYLEGYDGKYSEKTLHGGMGILVTLRKENLSPLKKVISKLRKPSPQEKKIRDMVERSAEHILSNPQSKKALQDRIDSNFSTQKNEYVASRGRNSPKRVIAEHYTRQCLDGLDKPTMAEFLMFYIYLQDIVLFSSSVSEEQRNRAYELALECCIERCSDFSDAETLRAALENRMDEHYFRDFNESEDKKNTFVVTGMQTLEHLCMNPSQDGRVVIDRSHTYDLDLSFTRMIAIKERIADFAKASAGIINQVKKGI